VDLLPDGEGRLLQCPGGAPANVAVGIARLGGQSAFIGRVGDDPFGRFMAKTLADERVDVKWMRLDPAHRTSTVVVDLDDHGERSFTFMVRPSADLFLEPPICRRSAPGSGCTSAPSPKRRAEPFCDVSGDGRHSEAGGYVSFDPNIRPDLWPDENALRRCLEQALQAPTW
jgi:fructokinase